MRVQHLNTNKYIPLVSCVSNLFTSWHCLLKPTYSHLSTASSSHGLRMWIFAEHITAVESEFLSYGVWSQAFFDVDDLSALSLSIITGGLVWSFRSSSLAVALTRIKFTQANRCAVH